MLLGEYFVQTLIPHYLLLKNKLNFDSNLQ